MSDQGVKTIRSRISVDVPPEIRWRLKSIALDKKMLFKDYIQDVLNREVSRQDRRPHTSN